MPSPRERQLIRRVFLEMDRAKEHHLSDVAQLFSLSIADLNQRAQNGEIDADDDVVRWREIAYLAVQRWGLLTIASALGAERSRVLPALVLPRVCTLTLPVFEIEMISALARRDGISRDAFLSNYLLDLAGTAAEEMEVELPGFTQAMRWPDA
jgi:hypothetical protein